MTKINSTNFGVQGLETYLKDGEYFSRDTKTTDDKFERFKDIVDVSYPGLCEYCEKSKLETVIININEILEKISNALK